MPITSDHGWIGIARQSKSKSNPAPADVCARPQQLSPQRLFSAVRVERNWLAITRGALQTSSSRKVAPFVHHLGESLVF
eukprot:474837-Amphidinium_carterae.2